MQSTIRAVLMRGGTSRGLVFRGSDLPLEVEAQDRILLAVMGSPDPYHRQTDGLGGATSSTSKVAIVERSRRPGVDVDYTFGQVDIERPLVDRAGNCGNLSSAIGPFAVDEGLVQPTPPMTKVRILNTNTDKVIVAHVPTAPDGSFEPEGDYEMPGVAGAGSRIVLDYLDPGGAVTGRLLPTSAATDRLRLADGSEVEASIVDAGNPVVFVAFDSVGITPETTADAIDSDKALLARLESVRAAAAVAAGLAATATEATTSLPSVPKLAFVGPGATYLQSDGSECPAGAVDLLVKSMSMGRTHRSYQLTAAICTAVAAALPGTLVERAAPASAHRPGGGVTVRIGHPAGVMELSASAKLEAGTWRAGTVSVLRTARRLMDGVVYVPAATLAAIQADPALAPR